MLENECEGGESIIVDGWQVAKDLKDEMPEYFLPLKILMYHLENSMKKMKHMLKHLY